MNRFALLLLAPLILAGPLAAQQAAPSYRAHLPLNSTMTADTDLIDVPGSATDLSVSGPTSGNTRTATYFTATVSLVSTASKVGVVRKLNGTEVRSWLNKGEALEPGIDYELSWRAFSGYSYNLQVETSTSGSLEVCEVQAAVSVAGLQRSAGSSGGLSSVSTTGDAFSGAGTSGDPLAAAPVLEALVDGGGTATAGAGTVLDLSSTGGLKMGATASGVLWRLQGTGNWSARLGDDSGYAGILAGSVAATGDLTVGPSGEGSISAAGAGTLTSLNMGTSGYVAFGTTGNDPRISKAATDRLLVSDGTNPAMLEAALLVGMSTSDATLSTFLSGEALSSSNTQLLTLTESAVPLRSYALSDTAGNGNVWQFGRWRGTVASPTVVQSGDLVASIQARGGSGSALGNDLELASIQFLVDGNAGTNDMPGRISFWTTPDGSSTSFERVRINNVGQTLLVGSGSASQVMLGLNNDTNTGIWGSADGNVTTAIAGVDRLTVDTSGIAAVGTSSASGAVKATTRYAGTVAVMSGSAVDFAAGPVMTKAVTTNLTLTTTTNSLPASGTGSTQTIVLTADGSGPYTLGFPSAWKWIGTKPSSLAASTSGILQLIATGNTEAGVIACYSVLGTGS